MESGFSSGELEARVAFILLYSAEETKARAKVWLVQTTQLSPVVIGWIIGLGGHCWLAPAAERRKGYGHLTKHRVSKLGPPVPSATLFLRGGAGAECGTVTPALCGNCIYHLSACHPEGKHLGFLVSPEYLVMR